MDFELFIVQNFPIGGRVQQAYLYAKLAHLSINQNRKYSGQPYIVHPASVLKILWDFGERDEDILIGALLHDVVEDVWPKNNLYSIDDIDEKFGLRVRGLVVELTDVFTSEAYPNLNRARRKELESNRISSISMNGLKIKLGDFIDNTSDIVPNDPGFAKSCYLPEKLRTLLKIEKRVQSSGDQILIRLYNAARSQIE